LEQVAVEVKRFDEAVRGFGVMNLGPLAAMKDHPKEGHAAVLAEWFDQCPWQKDGYDKTAAELAESVKTYGDSVEKAATSLAAAGRHDEADKLLEEHKRRVTTPNDWLGTVTGFDYQEFAERVKAGIEAALNDIKGFLDRHIGHLAPEPPDKVSAHEHEAHEEEADLPSPS
jgi:hypothetical protein